MRQDITMSVVKVVTRFSYHTSKNLWKHEIENICIAVPFLVYVDKYDTYVYCPTCPELDVTFGDVIHACNDSISSLAPVLCFPPVDMSTTTMLEFVGDHCLSDYAIEALTLGDAFDSCRSDVNAIGSVSDMSVFIENEYLKYLCTFVMRGAHISISTTLRSFIKYIFMQNGYLDEYNMLFPSDNGVLATKHTVIELTSEMMKCNHNMYTSDKYNRSATTLRTILAKRLSKNEAEYAVCGMVYDMLCDSVITCMGKLWCFMDGIWIECSSDGYLWNFLTNSFVEYLITEGAHSIASDVKSVHTRTKMLKDIKLRLLDDSFETLLDSKRELVRMKNGVLNTDTCSLHDAVPSDYVSVVTGVPYNRFDQDSYNVAVLMHILVSIFPHEDVLEFFIMSCGTFLEGFNFNKVLYIWWGTGNNAKSLVQTLVMKAFGEYCSTAPTSLITGKRTGSSSATPELCHVEKKLVVFLQEPNPEEKIKAGMIKEMTGNDRMYTRQLFRSGKTMMVKAKLVIVCNNIIEIPGMDAALRRRIVVLPFVSTFLDQREYNLRSAKGTLDADVRMIDPSIESQLLACSPAFMYLICNKYNEGKQFHVPQIIQDTTEQYLTRNNYQLMFMKRFLHVVEGSRTATTEAYERFKDWFKRCYPGKRVADLEVFLTELANEGYKDNGTGIIEDLYCAYNGDLVSHED